MRQALRAGIPVAEFWAMTPLETFMSIEAELWREERRQRQDVTAAWLAAKLNRAKRLPALKRLLVDNRPKRRLSGAELEKRREEFQEMSKNVNLDALNTRGRQ